MVMKLEPMKSGDTVTAMCGAVVRNANFMPMPNPPTDSILFCRKCFGQEMYFAAVTDGQNAIDLEAGVLE